MENTYSPSAKELEVYLEKWDSLENYANQERALQKLFSTTYPKNTNLDEVLIKVAALNDFYSTNIYGTYNMAMHILSLNIDENLKVGNTNLIEQIGRVVFNGKPIYFYSFATKYCSQHKPTLYPIFDKYVKKALLYFKNRDKFINLKNKDLDVKNYETYKTIIMAFQTHYQLTNYTFKQIDQYLWQLGKEM